MILNEYTYKINTSANPKGTATRIAYQLNKDDPFNYYTILYTLSGGYIIEKFGIKGMR